MNAHRTSAAFVRVPLRAAAAGLVVSAVLAGGPALADDPATWPAAPHVSPIDWLLVLLLIPAGVAIVIALLVSLPSMVKGDSYRPGETWAGDDEWFGGPSKGVAEQTDTAESTGPANQGGAGAEF